LSSFHPAFSKHTLILPFKAQVLIRKQMFCIYLLLTELLRTARFERNQYPGSVSEENAEEKDPFAQKEKGVKN
jgi:hypothetical protein